jgi:hypothetical protein
MGTGTEKKEMKPKSGVRNFALAVSLMVAVVIAVGLYVSGSPGSERARRFDEQRVGDLRSLSYATDEYAMREGELPESIDMIDERMMMKDSLTDPETTATYEYSAREGMNYELCAEFSLPSEESDDPYAMREPVRIATPEMGFAEPAMRDWTHPAGHHCYRLTAPVPQDKE